MLVLAVCNHKGGTGKTTSVLHLAAATGLSGRRTLVIDLDPQGFLTRTMGLPERANEDSVLALFRHDREPGEVDIRSMSGFDLIPSSSLLTKRMRSLNKPTDVLWVKESIDRGLLGREYDVILFDTAAAVTVYSLNALVASGHVLIPVLPEYQGVVGAEQTYQTIELIRNRLNPRLSPARFMFTQVDARKSIHHTYRQYMRGKYGDHVLDTIIRTSTALAESYKNGTTLFDHDPQARGARDYANATDELLRRVQREEASDPAPQPSMAPLSPPTPEAIQSKV
jgi:chromosome partitioning protein